MKVYVQGKRNKVEGKLSANKKKRNQEKDGIKNIREKGKNEKYMQLSFEFFEEQSIPEKF